MRSKLYRTHDLLIMADQILCLQCGRTWQERPPKSERCQAAPSSRRSKSDRLSVDEVVALHADRPYPDPAPEYGVPRGGSGSAIESVCGETLHLKLNGARLLHTHVANERHRGKAMQELIKQGLLPGCPDYRIWRVFVWPDLEGNLLSRPGLDIELKRETDWKVSRAQAEAIRRIRAEGGLAELAFGHAHAWAIVRACYRL